MAISMPTGRERFWWIFGAAGVAVMSALAIWWGVSASSGLSWTDTGHNVVDDRTIQLRFDIVDHDRGPVTCTLSALAESKAVVGRRTVQLPASEFDSTRHVVEVRTAQRAVAGKVDDCRRS